MLLSSFASMPELSVSRTKIRKFLVFLIIDILVASVIVGSVFYLNYSSNLPTQANTLLIQRTTDSSIVEEKDVESTIIPVSSEFINPFTGQILTQEQKSQIVNRPLFVMIDNSAPARKNHYNINRADIVYEAVTEGGWTRFMLGIYSDQSDFKIMPVRSIRMHFLNALMEYSDPLVYHVGGAYTPEHPNINVVQKLFDKNIKTIYYYNHTFDPVFHEIYDPECTKDPSIPGYSCKYQTTKQLWEKATSLGYQLEQWEPEQNYSWQWKFGTQNNSEATTAHTISYMFTMNKAFEAGWVYDANQDVYLRTTGGQKHMDKGTGEQIKTNTIIVQQAKHVLGIDDKGRAEVSTIGEGNGFIFSKGKQYSVTWKKECDTCRTRYYDTTSGKEFEFPQGRIWVSITRPQEKIVVL